MEELKNCQLRPIKTLGRGSFGSVSLVEADSKEFDTNTTFGRKVLKKGKFKAAVKYMETGKGAYFDFGDFQQAIAEMSILKNINHKNILSYEGNIVFGEDKYPFCTKQGIGYIMPKADSISSIKDYDVLKQIAYDVINSLAALHYYNIIHNDIKPGNMLTRKGRGYITDLGASVYLTPFNSRMKNGVLSYENSYLTTFYTAAPEVYDDPEHCFYSKEADMWAIGVSLYELFFNIEYIGSIEEHKELYKNTKGYAINIKKVKKIVPAKEINVIVDLISKLTTHDPTKRLTAEDALLHPFFNDVEFKSEDGGSLINIEHIKKIKFQDEMVEYAYNYMPKMAKYFKSNSFSWSVLALDYFNRCIPLLEIDSISSKDRKILDNYILAACIITASLQGIEVKNYGAELTKDYPEFKDYVSYFLNLDVNPINYGLYSICRNGEEFAHIYKNYLKLHRIIPSVKKSGEDIEKVMERKVIEYS